MITTKDIYLAYKLGNQDLEKTLEDLTHLGYCPALLNDDNGHFALAFDGIQNVSTSSKAIDTSTTFFVHKKDWKNTTIKAVLHGIKSLYDGEVKSNNTKRSNAAGNSRKRRSK